jgi:hypothetical protein
MSWGRGHRAHGEACKNAMVTPEGDHGQRVASYSNNEVFVARARKLSHDMAFSRLIAVPQPSAPARSIRRWWRSASPFRSRSKFSGKIARNPLILLHLFQLGEPWIDGAPIAQVFI